MIEEDPDAFSFEKACPFIIYYLLCNTYYYQLLLFLFFVFYIIFFIWLLNLHNIVFSFKMLHPRSDSIVFTH